MEAARDVEFKGLQADPDGGLTLMKNMTERYRIIEERSRHSGKKGKGDRSKTEGPHSGPLNYGAGLLAGAEEGPLNGGERRTPQ